MRILYADGIGSAHATQSQSVIYKIVERLLWANPEWTETRVIWPASMAGVGGDKSWTEASKIGVDFVNEIVASSPDEKFVLLGYSGGNRVIHEWMEQNLDDLNKVAAVGLMSDPWRPQSQHQYGTPGTSGWGLCGQKFGPIPDRTFWTAVQGDAITDAKPDALLRTVADVSDVMPGQFLSDLFTHITMGNLQLAWEFGVIQKTPLGWLQDIGPRLDQARRDIEGYFGTKHTSDYTNPYDDGPSLAYRLADSISWHINSN